MSEGVSEMAGAAKKAKAGLNVPAVQKILTLLKQRHDDDGALIEELERLVGGGPGIGDILKELYAYWNDLWHAVYGSDYVFTFTRDAPQMKRLVRQLGPDEVRARMLSYLKDREVFVADKKHPFGLFVSMSNKYAGLLAGADDAAAVGCKHTPRCTTDLQHTTKKLKEARQ